MNQSVIQRAGEQSEMTETLQPRDTVRGQDEVTQIATDPKYPDMISSSSRDETYMETLTNIESIAAKGKKRKPLHTLQPAANKNEVLVSADRVFEPIQPKRIKTQSIIKKKKKNRLICKKVTKGKTIQTVQDNAIQTVQKEKIEIADLIPPANCSENDWQSLFEKKRLELEIILDANKSLCQVIEIYKEEISSQKKMFNELKITAKQLKVKFENEKK